MRTKSVDLSQLSPEQRDAFIQFYRDARAVGPQYQEMRSNAQTLFTQWLKSPQWQANDGQPPAQAPDQAWSGAPDINYVDKLEGQP